jgi:uncharacterized protein YjiS (DUF1127 family)
MSTNLSPIKSLTSNVGLYLSKRRDRKLLLRLDDRTLNDISISRELLEQGVRSWPWRLPDDSILVATAANGIRTAVKELETYSDAELADLGISRGSIQDAVLYGRPGIEQPQNDNNVAAAA